MNSLPFRQLKSFLKILIGVQYETALFQNAFSRKERKTMDRRIRLTALMLAASLLLNMVVLPVHGQEDTAPSAAQVSQENEPTKESTEETTATVPAPPQTTAPSATMQTQAPTVPEETTQAAETTEPTVQTEPTQATQETTEPAETEPALSLFAAEPEIPQKDGNTYKIESLAQLVGLSTLPASNYANSNIEIVFKSGDLSSVADQFKGLGSSSAPFAGKLIFNSDAEASLTLSRPLFNYLSSQATCAVNNSATGYLQLTDKNAEGALLAKVLTAGGTGSEWKIAVYNSRADDVQPYSVPIIGTMEAGSAMTLSVKDSYRFPVKAANAGLLCGAMEENAQLTLEHYEQITEKETGYFIKDASGAGGGLVGKMGKGAALTVKPDLTFPEKTIQAAGGAGDLVGEMGENAILTVAGSLTCAGKIDAGTGGSLVGQMGKNAQVKVTGNLALNVTEVKTASGAGGGLVGEMGESAALTVSGSLTCAGKINAGGSGGSLVGQMGKNAQMKVKGNLALNVTEVTAGGSAGGLVGQMAEGSALSLPKTNELTVQTNLSGSNAGGLVGEMKDGARLSGLSGTAKVTVSGTVKATQNAGGLIGIAKNLVLDGGMSEVTATKITGSSTAGGLIGSYTYSKTGDYYNGSTGYPSVNVNLSDSGGNVGGLYGYVNVRDTAENFYLKGDKTVTVTAAKGNSLGGLVGRYEANSLTAQSLTVNTGEVSLSGNGGDSYGGIIGSVHGNNGVYIEVQKAAPTCTANNNAANNVGGIIGKLDGGGHMLRLSGVTASGLPGNSASGGLVGYMQKGVMYLGKDITITKPGSGGKNGWVLGDRDNTLVYTDQIWNPKKDTTNDIGGWGQVVRSNNLPGVLTYDATKRAVTVAAPSGAEGTYTVGNAAEFAELALRYQLDETDSLKFANGDANLNAAQTIDLTANVNYLENIGITGFQRDVSNTAAVNVTLNGRKDLTVTLPDIPVYTGGNNHDRQGLFAKTTNLTASALTLDGKITVHGGGPYMGALCAQTEQTAKLTQVTGRTAILADKDVSGAWISGLITTAFTAEYTNCQWSGIITDESSADNNIGGFFARNDTAGSGIAVTNGTLSGTISKPSTMWADAKVGGLAASLGAVWWGNDHVVNINGLTVDGLEITTGSNSASGGLLGYEWLNTRATITGVSVKNSTLDAGTNARFGGLVYTGSGYWRVQKGTATAGIHFVSGNVFTGKSEQNAPSGLIVAKGEKNGNTALYLEIREDAYKAEGTTVNIGGSQYFDEIVGSNQSGNNNGIVSIALPDHALIDRDGCNTYQSQLRGTWVNGKTRYYYNLDAYRDELGYDAKTDTIADSPNLGIVDNARKLMLWNAYHDCEENLRGYFSAQRGFVISKEINLGGYSFYPTPFINDTSIQNASITFDYDTMNDLETGANNKPLGQSNSQHYQMHTGIFNGGTATNKDQNLNVNGLKLSGTVGRSATGTGALCCGPFTGSSIYDRMYLTIQNVDLAGIRISEKTGNTDQVCPLLIYSLGSYSTLDMNGVKTSTGYDALNADSTKYAASSLIGRVGGTTGKEIRLTFKGMCLDGRPGRNNTPMYGTTGCIFSRALFLESFDYVETTSSGVYNFTEAEREACTLGRELSNSADGPVSGRNNNEQRWYYGGKLEGKLVSGSANGWNSFYQNYTRYVYQLENLTVGSTQHELDVNLNTTGLEIGCGTGTDPYIITEFSQLRTLNQVLRDGTAEKWPVNLDTEVLVNVQNKQSFADTDEHTRYDVKNGHVSYTYSPKSGKWEAKDNPDVTPAVMRLYLQNAHYKLEENITADNNWDGLGHADSTGQTGSQIIAFGGEIDGGGKTFTIPGSTASQFGGLVKYSMGSVVRNITIEYTGSISLSCTEVPNSEISPSFFGGVVGYAFGGDTILDGVTVSIANPPETKGSHSYLAAVGGYVGLVGGAFNGTSNGGNNKYNKYGGGVVFRGRIGSGLTGGKAEENSGQFYYNPYVGRVLDGYVLGDGVSLDNTNKNYQIPNISSAASVNSHLEIFLSGKNATATVKDAQGLWLLSAIANSGAAAMDKFEAYSFSRPRIGSYEKDDTCLGGVSLTAKTASQCYLSKYVSGDFSKLAAQLLTIRFTADCDMRAYGNGFRGIGGSYVCISFGSTFDHTRQLHIQTVDGRKSDGERAVITLNQQRNEYETEKNKWTVSGSGLFLAVRNAANATFSNLILSGKTGITYFDGNGKPCQAKSILDMNNGLWDQSKRANMAAAGMLISGFCATRDNAVILNGVTLQNASVNGDSDSLGCATAGGFIGMIGFSTQFQNEAKFIDCTYENLTVRALIMAGGFAGYSAAMKVTVSNTQDVELTGGDIRTTAPFYMTVENSSRQDAGGLFGHIHLNTVGKITPGALEINPEGNAIMTIRNLTVKNTATGVNDITVGGLVGYENVAKGQTVTVKGVRLEGKVELIGGESTNARTNVGGLFGFLSDSNNANNQWSVTSDKVYNLSVSNVTIGGEPGSAVRMANGRQMGGLIGLVRNPGGQMTIDQVSIGSESGPVQILAGSNGSSDCITGGLLGMVCLYPSITLTNIRLNHAAIIGKGVSGGVIGQIDNQSNNKDYATKVQMNNLAIENSDIAACNSQSSVGGLYGYLSRCSANLTGYNILLKDNRIGYLLNDQKNNYRGSVPNEWTGTLPIGLVNGNSGKAGIFGGQRNPGGSAYSFTLKFTGVSLVQAENTVPTQDFGTALSTGDYLVRADYTGVQDNTGSENDRYPYVTINPLSPLKALLGQNVTGDGACFAGTPPIGEKIRSESGSTENRNLTHTAVEEAREYLTGTETNRPSDMAYFGSFTGDGDNGAYTGGNFPVFVISTTSTDEANRALYSALSLLTNRVMYGKTITNDLDPAPPADMKLSLTNYVYSDGQWKETQEDGSFTLNETTKRIRLNGQYDNQRARFSLLRADFANPADANETVYTLYLPILVKKVFNFRFWASALAGTSYIQSNYDDLNRLAIVSENEKVTALLGFDYTRTREEWQKAVNDGENLLWNFLKQLQLSVKLPDSTRLVLVDRNNRDKAWYATASQALQKVDSYYELKFTSFRDQAGTSWTPVTLSQLLPLTAAELTAEQKADGSITGKFVIAADKTQATVQIGDTYYRKATDEDKNQTQYAITVGELNGELSERYYLTIQAQTEEQRLLNILLTCDDRLTNPAGNGLPTKRLAASETNPTNNGFARNGDENRIIITSCFEQTVSLTTADGQLELISDGNTTVVADVNATIQFKDTESANRFQDYASDQKLSQCFNLVLYHYYEDGPKTQVDLTPGTQITAVYRYGENTWTKHYIVDTATRSYRLTFPEGIPCSDIKAHPVTLTAELTLDFASSYADQFPIRERKNEGILMAVTSTLSYTPQTLTSSTLSTQPPSEDTLHRHFYRGEVSVASLNYDAVGDTEMDSINQLGINGFEGDSAKLRSAASYNVSAVSRAENAKYLRCTLTLSPRDNTGTQPFVSYGAAVPWINCLTGEKMKLSLCYTDSQKEVIEAANPTNTQDYVSATYTATFQLNKALDKNVPLEISADMTLLAGAALEANGMTYANYKIRLEAELLDEKLNTINGSNASDYLVYTNSRIYKNIIPRT